MKIIKEHRKQPLPDEGETISTFAATVNELIEILQQYPGDWPVMIPNQGIYDYRSALHGFFIYEGGAHHIKDYFYDFYEHDSIPDETSTIPALLLDDWERG